MTRTGRLTPWIGVGVLAFAIAAWIVQPNPAGREHMTDLFALWLGIAILAVAWWRASIARHGSMEARYALPVGVAVAGMLAAATVARGWGLDWLLMVGIAWYRELPQLVADAISGPLRVLGDGWLLLVLAVTLPLARMLSQELPDGRLARATRVIMVGLAIAALLIGGYGPVMTWSAARLIRILTWVAISGITALPAAMIALHLVRTEAGAAVPAGQRMTRASAYLAIGAASGIAGLAVVTPRWPLLLIPTVAALLAAAVVVKVAVDPLSRVAGAAVTQRDLVVSATETERVRLAAELHDGPLADLSLLIQDLDDRHDADGAASARAIATDLRGIGSDLRLPILDDLGVGPALEWLVARSVQRFGEEIALELDTAERQPAAVELAVYRIAQEAIRNAIEHGQAPVTVRYQADGAAAILEVDDSGPGLFEPARTRALESGRLGLVSMVQRAETIGAELTLTVRPGGGTRVRLRWSRLPIDASGTRG